MKFYKILALTALAFLAVNCGNTTDSNGSLFQLKVKDTKKKHKPSDVVAVSIINKKNKTIDSIAYYIDDAYISSSEENKEISLPLSGLAMGKRAILAKVYSEGNTIDTKTTVAIHASKTPTIYTYKILEVYPHDINAYTQGLEFIGDTLYESTGQYGKSSLRKTNYKTGEVLEQVDLAGDIFGEGITHLNDKIYQLTWKSDLGFIYDRESLKKTGSFVYGQSKQGWGLCNNANTIFKSDGTEKIWRLNPQTLAEDSYLEVYTNVSKIDTINELEWVNEKIYANVYGKDAITMVDPETGAVEGVINLKGLKAKVKQHKELNVLNGIAYRGEENILYVTGKNWDKLFKIEIMER